MLTILMTGGTGDCFDDVSFSAARQSHTRLSPLLLPLSCPRRMSKPQHASLFYPSPHHVRCRQRRKACGLGTG